MTVEFRRHCGRAAVLAAIAAICCGVACGQPLPPPASAPSASAATTDPAQVTCDMTTAAEHPDPANIRINEAFAGSRDEVQDDWFEVHNAGAQPVTLTGWVVEDHFTNGAEKGEPGRYTFPATTTLCPDSFLVTTRCRNCADATKAFSFGLGRTDGLALRDGSGRIVDEVSWDHVHRGEAVGRADDASPTFVRLAADTPGAPNAISERMLQRMLGR